MLQAVVRWQAGHSSIQVTMDTYGHLFPSGNRGFVGKLDEPDTEAQTTTQTQPAAGCVGAAE